MKPGEPVLFIGTQNKVRLVISVLLALAFLAAAFAKLTGNEMMVGNFARYGYPLWFMYFVGVAELAGAIGLLLKPTAVWAAVCLGVLMLGAVGTHFINDPATQAVPAIVLLILCAVVAYMSRGASTVATA